METRTKPVFEPRFGLNCAPKCSRRGAGNWIVKLVYGYGRKWASRLLRISKAAGWVGRLLKYSHVSTAQCSFVGPT